MRTTLFLLLSIGLHVNGQEGPDSCCTKGHKHATNVLINGADCRPDEAVTSSFEGFNKLLCTGFFQQCCKQSSNVNYCTMGERLALANQLCLTNQNVGGAFQRSCCECCKRGRTQGLAGGNCKSLDNDYLCASAFEKCCNKARANKPTDPPQKTCSDIDCSNDNSQGCSETSKGPLCSCKAGYKNKNDGTCEDIDECLSNPCTENSSCENNDGSFSCKCEQGFVANGEKCEAKKETDCKDGYELVDGKCVDVDECISGTHRCPQKSFCLNELGDYRCLQNCPYPNYQVIKAGICEDVDECKRNIDNCQRNFQCINTVGTYHCKRERCDEGYKLVNGYCQDVDECENDSDICGAMGTCRNAHGRYYCDCQQGYSVNPKTRKCEDVDECKINKGYCNHQCVNTLGSYRCTCPAGYETRGRYCHDQDECSTGNPCGDGLFCFNTFGSYACINQTCPNSYFIKTSKKREPAACQRTDCHGDLNCRRYPLQSVKRVTYRFYKNVAYRGFVFNYWTNFDNRYYNVDTFFTKGNEDKTFYIEYVSSTQMKIINQKRITGPTSYHLVMKTDVKTKTGKLQWSYIYEFYVYVAAYNFA